MSDRIRIRREELFTPQVNKAIEKERRLRGRAAPPAPPLSPWRRLLFSSLFYLPLAGGLAAVLSWLIVEPSFHDWEHIGGEVTLVNTTPMGGAYRFESQTGPLRAITVEKVEVLAVPGVTRLEPGTDGQPAYAALDDIAAGDVIEVAGQDVKSGPNTIVALGLRPATREEAAATGSRLHGTVTWARIVFFPLTAVLIAVALLAAEGIASRNWARMVERCGLGLVLTVVFVLLAFIPAGAVLFVGERILGGLKGPYTVHTMPGTVFVSFTVIRSIAWAILSAALGLGMNLVRSTKVQLRNSVVGGALGGALGGAFFDPVNRFLSADSWFAGGELSRLVGMTAVGLCVGLFVALVDQLAREAWLRVRTGPLAGKAFVLYRSPAVIGSAPDADIYLFKDAEISARHASIHRVGNRYEIEDMNSRMGTRVRGARIRRQRLESGDQVVVGATVLEFEERAKPSRP